jgi:hypothetical protein
MHTRFLRILASADSLLHQLWSLPSALADILIAIAMTLLVRRASPSLILQHVTDCLQKLRQTSAKGHFPNYILLRVVRLTIETNALTGIYTSINSLTTFVHFIPFEASVAIASFVLYVAFPVG